jgi:hypothetical protein
MRQSSGIVALCVLVFGWLTISTSEADENTEIEAAGDQYIVVFHDHVSRKEALRLTRLITSEYRLRLRHTYKDAVIGFSAVFPPGALDKLRNHPDIAVIEANRIWYIEGSQSFVDTVDAPTNLTITPVGDAQLDLSWTDNATTESGTVIERSTTGIGGTYSRLTLLRGSNIESYSDTDVSVGQEYCYQVQVGESGTVLGPFSAPACGLIEDAPPVDPPAAPSGLSTTTVNDQRIDLDWVDESDNETGFRVERAAGQGGTFTEIDLTGTNVNTYESTGLTADSEYCYRVRAYNSVGDSAYSNESCATTDTEPPPTSALGAPTGLTATAPSETSVDLSWQDNATEENGFEVQRSSSGIGGPYSSLAILRSSDQIAYTDTSVASGTEYCYQVRAGRGPGDFGEFSNQSCVTPGDVTPTDPPAAPDGLTTAAVDHQRIDLDWLDNSDNEDGFEIERATGVGGLFSQIDVVGANVQSYVDSTLDPETEYCYRVRAYNVVGDSGYTLDSCATTPEEPPPGTCLDTGNHDDIGLDWGLDHVDAELNIKWQATQGVGCAMTPVLFGIDTGVDGDHPDLNVAETMDFTSTGNGGEDDHGHGSHTAGTAAAVDGNGGAVGVAPGAPIYGFKVCDINGSCATADIIAGVDEVTARRNADPSQPMVANMSLGGGASETNDTAVRRSVNAGVVYALSAGNGVLGACIFPADAQNNSPARTGDDLINVSDGSDGDTARVNGIITTTSSNETDNDNDCNFGDPVTVAAPGNDIYSTWLDGGYATIGGTSMATPHVAGAAILYLQDNPDATPTEVEQAIMNLLVPWFPDDLPNADGRLDVSGL